jgi:hypothetical protein
MNKKGDHLGGGGTMGKAAEEIPGATKEQQRLRHLLVFLSGAFELSAVPFAAATPEGHIQIGRAHV